MYYFSSVGSIFKTKNNSRKIPVFKSYWSERLSLYIIILDYYYLRKLTTYVFVGVKVGCYVFKIEV